MNITITVLHLNTTKFLVAVVIADINQDENQLVQIIPALHGTPSLEIAWKIAETGFAALSTTDAGFFGKGTTLINYS